MPETMKEATLGQYLALVPRARTALLPALIAAQAENGYVSDDDVRAIAWHLRVTENEVEGVVTGYPDLRRQPPPRRVVRVCTGASCRCAGALETAAALESTLGVRLGEAGTAEVALEEAHCLFLCALGPAFEVDGRVHGRATADRVTSLIGKRQESEP